MKLAVMQPYLFPYLGYFQLIGAVDAFVVYDDVSYINRGWINRNSILAQGKAQLITLELNGASQNRLISEVSVGDNRKKLLKTIRHCYSQAPQFHCAYPMVEEILTNPERNLASFLDFSLRRICDYLGIHVAWHRSSQLEKDQSLRGQEKILAICDALHATCYINLPGGRELYYADDFAKRGTHLSFIQPNTLSYPQYSKEFIPNLSIIDVVMFNTQEQSARLLKEYTLA